MPIVVKEASEVLREGFFSWNVGKLEGDHKNAKVLAEGLNKIKGIRVDAASVETNIFYFDIEESSKHTAETLSKYLQQRGILVMLEGPSRGNKGRTKEFDKLERKLAKSPLNPAKISNNACQCPLKAAKKVCSLF
ncbi:hypothetical protein SO802_010501 [Lithocarpus litseifolius]|uniref:Uncharacterized protein n=1 Tax=Lithocarpus litseifolius TaxID=425828 RepID=A0AAW2DFL1_9ROSI